MYGGKCGPRVVKLNIARSYYLVREIVLGFWLEANRMGRDRLRNNDLEKLQAGHVILLARIQLRGAGFRAHPCQESQLHKIYLPPERKNHASQSATSYVAPSKESYTSGTLRAFSLL